MQQNHIHKNQLKIDKQEKNRETNRNNNLSLN